MAAYPPENVATCRRLLIETAIDDVTNAVVELGGVVAMLHDHLQPLLGPARPMPPNDAQKPAVESEVGSRLSENALNISLRCVQIRELIERL